MDQNEVKMMYLSVHVFKLMGRVFDGDGPGNIARLEVRVIVASRWGP